MRMGQRHVRRRRSSGSVGLRAMCLQSRWLPDRTPRAPRWILRSPAHVTESRSSHNSPQRAAQRRPFPSFSLHVTQQIRDPNRPARGGSILPPLVAAGADAREWRPAREYFLCVDVVFTLSSLREHLLPNSERYWEFGSSFLFSSSFPQFKDEATRSPHRLPQDDAGTLAPTGRVAIAVTPTGLGPLEDTRVFRYFAGECTSARDQVQLSKVSSHSSCHLCWPQLRAS